MGSYNYTISIGHLGEQLTLNQWVLGSSPRWCTKVQPYGKRRAVFLLQFPGMRRTGAPSGTRTGRVGRFAYRPTTKPQWGFVSPRESPRGNEWRVQINGGSKAVFLLQFPGMLRIGAPSGTRTARAPRFAYRGAKTPRWGVFRARESPRGNEWRMRLGGGGAI